MSSSSPAHVSGAAASCADERTSGGITRRCLKRKARMEDGDNDGCALSDELLLHIFANCLDMAGLVRCAATCRRWRRLVASEAEFICRRRTVSSVNDVGFFHQRRHGNDSGRFLPPSAFWCAFRFRADLFKKSRLLASRGGRLLLELRSAAALRLSVADLTTGVVFHLPSLSGNERPEQYSCAFLAADDLHAAAQAFFRVVLLYKRGHDAMACRCISSDDATAWGPEGTVSGANVSSRRLGEMAGDAGVAVPGSGAVFWLAGKVVFGLCVATLQAVVESPKLYGAHRAGFSSPYPDHRRLTVLPDGRLGAVQVGRGGDGAGAFVVNVFARNDGKRARRWVWEQTRDVDLGPLLPAPAPEDGGAMTVLLRAVCEESGLVFFATMDGHGRVAPYALDLEKKKVQAMQLVRPAGRCCFRKPSCRLAAFMAASPVAYLRSLGGRDIVSCREEDDVCASSYKMACETQY